MYKIYNDGNGNQWIRGNDANETLPTNLPMGTTALIVDGEGVVTMKWLDEETRTWVVVDDTEDGD